MTNEERTKSAQAALDAFQELNRTDDEDAISDLICNLLHLANKTGEGGMTALKRGLSHFLAEATDAPDGMVNMRIEITL